MSDQKKEKKSKSKSLPANDSANPGNKYPETNRKPEKMEKQGIKEKPKS